VVEDDDDDGDDGKTNGLCSTLNFSIFTLVLDVEADRNAHKDRYLRKRIC